MNNKSVTHGTELVTVSGISLQKAWKRVSACQECSTSVSRSFGSVLVEVLGASNPRVEYVLCAPARCPNCGASVVESTLVRCDGERTDEMDGFAPPLDTSWEDTNVVLVNETLLRTAQASITGCERCAPHAEMTFDYILDAITECDPAITEYVLCRAAKCPCCDHEVTEKTFIVAH